VNFKKENSFQKWSGKSFHVLAAKYLNEFNPYLAVCSLDYANRLDSAY
jgi:hypothetical protein